MRKVTALVAHAYLAGVSREQAAEYNAAVCQEVFRLHRGYDHVFVLSGYGSKVQGVGFSMEEQVAALRHLGVPIRLIHTQQSLCLTKYRSPVDTLQEVYLLSNAFKSLGWRPRDVEFHAVGVASHTRRISLAYKRVHANCTRVIACNASTGFFHEAYELCALLMTFFDPLSLNPYLWFTRWRRGFGFNCFGERLPNVWK